MEWKPIDSRKGGGKPPFLTLILRRAESTALVPLVRGGSVTFRPTKPATHFLRSGYPGITRLYFLGSLALMNFTKLSRYSFGM